MKIVKSLLIVLIALGVCFPNTLVADEDTEQTNNGNHIAETEENYIDSKWEKILLSNYASKSAKSIAYKYLYIANYYQTGNTDIMQDCNETIGYSGCALTSVTMAYNYLKNQSKTPSQINSLLGSYACPMDWINAAATLGLNSVVHTAPGTGAYSYESYIYTYLMNNIPVIIGMTNFSTGSEHFVLVKGMNITSSSATYYINDPSQIKNYTTLASYLNAGYTVTYVAVFTN